MSDRTKEYSGREVTISYDPARCIHAAECVRGAPEVFDPDARPWIDADGAEGQRIADVVQRCPTGALTLRFNDGRPAEVPDPLVTATLVADGPLYLRGKVVIDGGEHAAMAEYARLALCRCGASSNKPFCDGSHTRIGFKDCGTCPEARAALGATAVDAARAASPAAESARMQPVPAGPMRVAGRIEFRTADGNTFVAGDPVWLCRCGASANKPFCDGSHQRVGFQD